MSRDPRARPAWYIGAGAVLLLALAAAPLLRLQLGDRGWAILLEDAAGAFWPLAAGAALCALGLLTIALLPGLRSSRRAWSPIAALFVLLPTLLVVSGVAVGIASLVGLPIPRSGGMGCAMEQVAASLAAPAWSLFLTSALAAAGAVVLAARTFGRAVTVVLPWGTLVAGLVGLALLNTFLSWAKLPLRPLTATLLCAAVLAPLLAAATGADELLPEPETRRDSGLATSLLLALLSGLAAAGGEALLFKSAALYAQGSGVEAHLRSQALGGATGTTFRLVVTGLIVATPAAAAAVAAWQLRHRLGPGNRRATRSLVVALVLTALGLIAVALHRYLLAAAIGRAAGG